MKFRVDVMPDLPCDCPFFVPGEHTCELDKGHCDYFKDEEGHINDPLDCRYLIDESAEEFLKNQKDNRYW